MHNKNIKIAIVAYNLENGGLSNAILSLYRILDHKDFNVELLLFDQEDKPETIDSYKCFKVTGNNKLRFVEKLIRYYNFTKHVKKSKYDFIIDERFRLNIFSEILIQKIIYSNLKTIIAIHSSKLDTYLPHNKIVTRFLFKDVYKIVCCSNSIKLKIEDKYQINNVQCIYNSINVEPVIINPLQKNESKYIVAVGRIEPLKQFDKLITTYSKTNLAQKGIKLVFLGDGSQLKECKNLTKSLGLEDQIIFKGYVKKTKEYIKNAQFLVVCSKYEGFPMVILESIALTTPVLSFDLESGPNEIIVSGENGMLVENQNFSALKEGIEALASDTKQLDFFRSNTKKSIVNFSDVKIKKQWEELLQNNRG